MTAVEVDAYVLDTLMADLVGSRSPAVRIPGVSVSLATPLTDPVAPTHR